jgi:hypothetical protein
MNAAFVWYLLKHPRIHNPTLHFLHLMRMLLLFSCAEQTRQFILLAQEVGQWCQLASSRWDVVVDRAGCQPMGHCGWGGPLAACYSMFCTRARRKSWCDNFAQQDEKVDYHIETLLALVGNTPEHAARSPPHPQYPICWPLFCQLQNYNISSRVGQLTSLANLFSQVNELSCLFSLWEVHQVQEIQRWIVDSQVLWGVPLEGKIRLDDVQVKALYTSSR